MRPLRFTLRWIMTQIAFLSLAFALLAAAAKESARYHCGHPLLDAVLLLALLVTARLALPTMVRAYSWSPPEGANDCPNHRPPA